MEWQPISTAPKDGTRILVCRPKGFSVNRVGVDMFMECGGRKSWIHSEDNFQPTHWMPLPEPPKGN